MTTEENRELRDKLNEIHKQLTKSPRELKYAFPVCFSGVLNAYREGDITHEYAETLLSEISKEQNKWNEIETEGYPEKSGWYLVYEDDVKQSYYYKGATFQQSNATHWREIPSPPKQIKS